tara:strand:- start:113 stop:778 length:666 start_codon:yes stop_codon:yes gene_type:complete
MNEQEEIKQQLEDSYTYHFFFNHGLFEDLMNFEELIKETKIYLAEKIKTHKKLPELNPTDERFGMVINFEYFYPSILWKSLLLSIYFQTESALDQICQNLKKSNNYELTLKDIQGNGIFRSSLYLKKVCGIKAPFQTENWSKIIDFNKVRNILVHSDGILSNSNNKLKTICKKYDGIVMTEMTDDEISITIMEEFCSLMLDNVQELFNKIYSEMTEKKACR